ncbi:MAG: radical SAM protein [Clostridiaceae bacterium]|nr:radical SAM protein [Clostridiaceae bacterium]
MSDDIKRKDNNQLAKEWESSEMTLAAHAARRHVPLGGTFELTPRCNLRCKMCYVRLDRPQMDKIGRELTADEWIALAKDAAEAGTLNLLITGGEPLLRDDFAQIYTALANMGFIISLNTNATLMNPEILKLFKKYPPTATNVTLYGASPETYEKVSGNADGFHQTLRGLDMLSEVPTVLEVRSTFIKDNMHELDDLRSIANRYTKRFAINVNVFRSLRGANSDIDSCRLTPSQALDIEDANMQYYEKLNSEAEGTLEHNMEIDNYANIKDYGFDLPPKTVSCLASKSMFWLAWDGKMLPCGTFSNIYTTPMKEGFKHAWDRLPSLLEDVTRPDECKTCHYANGRCTNCPAILHAECGCFDKLTSTYICKMAEEKTLRRG